MGQLVSVSPSEAIAFTKQYHYTNSATYGMIRYGWEIDGELAGVTIYNAGNHDMRKGVFGSEHYTHVLHHHRLALHPDAPKFTASQFIGASLRQLVQDYSNELWAVVTYADSCYHDGTIYRATNAIYTGLVAKGNLKFITPDGVIKPTQSVQGTWPERRKEAANLGWTEIRCKGKHRYVYLTGTGRQKKVRPPMLWPEVPLTEQMKITAKANRDES